MHGNTTHGADWIDRVANQYGRGRPVAVLFDYDGTLTPIVRHPSLARLTPEARRQLRRLAALPDVRVGVISGRALGDVRALVGVEGAYYAGSGGLEIDLLGEMERCSAADAADGILTAIEDELLDLLRKFPGTWLERKPGAVSLHFRGLLPLAAVCFRYEATELLSVVDELRFRVVSEAIEVTPADGWDKGAAVIAILSHMEERLGLQPVAVYIGDAANDAEGMAVAAHTGGVSLGVGSDAPGTAQFRLADTVALTTAVDELTDRLVEARALHHLDDGFRRATAPLSKPAGGGGAAADTSTGDGLLIVDPDPVFRARVSADMGDLGWRVWQADTPEAAATLMRANGSATQVILVDLQLPGLQGARTLSELGEGTPGAVRCCMSADISPYTATAFGRLSAVPIFVKPFSASELDAALRSMLAADPVPV